MTEVSRILILINIDMDLFLDGGELEIEDDNDEASDGETEGAKQSNLTSENDERVINRPPPAVGGGKVIKQPAHKVVGKQNSSAN